MSFTIRQAKRSATKLRLLIDGPSGSGKTWGALQVAKGLGGRTVVIDTEEGSSDLYDSLHDFGVIDLKPPFTPERYIQAIGAAEAGGADVIIVDSITQEWSGKGGCLELVDEIARAQFRGNTWSAYSVMTPRHRAFIDAMLRSTAHIIATGRAKTETAQVDDGGKKRVAKLGMKIETRDGVEYEFTTVLDLIHDGHFATVSKDRTGIFAGQDPKPITVETGRKLLAWLSGGIPAPVVAAPPPAKTATAVQGPAPGNDTGPLAVSPAGSRPPAESIGRSAGPAANDEPTLFGTISDYIAGAKAVKTLGAIADRIEVLVSEGQLTYDQAHDLTEEINKRHDQIEPKKEELTHAI
jgi:hypothetical protein